MTKLPYQQLLVWKNGIALVFFVYEITKKFPKEELFILVPQMRRAALSVPSNIAEGSLRKTNKDFAHFLHISMGSLVELETQGVVAHGLRYLNQADFDRLLKETEELKKMLYAFIKKLEQ